MTYPSERTGQPSYIVHTGAAGTDDNDVIYASGDISDFDVHYIERTAGTVDVDISFDGTNWVSAVALRDLAATASATFVSSLGAGKAGELRGRFAKLRVNQAGATASNARIVHARWVAQ
jgi:hypothetical protein